MPSDNQFNYEFVCDECLNNEYKLTEFGICKKCTIYHCKRCAYTNNYSKQECLECGFGYRLTSEKDCVDCEKLSYISHGYCFDCYDDLNNLIYEDCECFSYYFINERNECSHAPNDCQKWIILEDESIYCLRCDKGYYLSIDKCLRCPKGCSDCYLENNNQIKCSSCDSYYVLLNGKCKYCYGGCDYCIIQEDNIISCQSCSKYYYAFNPNKTCTYCRDIKYLGDKCSRCQYNQIKNKYECLECDYEDHYNVYIINEFQCLSNSDSKQIYLFGCLEANYTGNNKYECFKCQSSFSYIKNDKICKKSSETNLSKYCLEIVNFGDILNPIYSCNKCHNDTVLIIDSNNNRGDCYERSDNLVYCLKGIKYGDNNLLCTECIEFSHLNENNSICECDYGCFGINNLSCYKCDDKIKGNSGCLPNEGCTYVPKDSRIICNKCKNNYFEYDKGQCYLCENEIEFCNKCHLDQDNKLICDECKENFIYDKFEKRCQLNCKEYPEISPGCIICNEEYIFKRKCQACKPGYFKTENESCIYCRTEKYGISECDKYIKNETGGNRIFKRFSGKYKIVDSFGKYHILLKELDNNCEIYEFIGIRENQKLICLFCKEGYYLDFNGNCVYFMKYLKKVDNCSGIDYYFLNTKLEYRPFYENNKYYIYYSRLYANPTELYKYDKTILETINYDLMKINDERGGVCQFCDYGYLFDFQKKCVPIKIENCTILSMIKNNLLYDCKNFCKSRRYPLVFLYLNNNKSSYITFDEIYNKFYITEKFLNKFKILYNLTLCIDTSENNEKHKLTNCFIAKYFANEDKYLCYLCQNGFFLNEETNQCIEYDEKYNCEYENLGNETNPIYSCKKCKPNKTYSIDYYYSNYLQFLNKDEIDDYSSDYLLLREGNINFCIYPDSNLQNCLNGIIDTTYINNKYNCTSCKKYHLPYYSQYYERIICQSILNEIKTSQNINLNNYLNYNVSETINGECPNNTLFTPDGKYCYKCNSSIGMPGCNSQCSFSLKKNDIIKCLDGCREGYIESSEGICQKCSDVNDGCTKCYYGEYPINYFGIKRKRKFVCSICNSNFYILKDDKCIKCDKIQKGCVKCEIINDEFICIECNSSYILDEKGICNYYCENGFYFGNKCMKCNEVLKGGIEGCEDCKINESKISCLSCEEGYILLHNNKTCLKIYENSELIKHYQCAEVYLEKGKLNCLKCKDYRFSLLKEKNESNCIYLPELNGYADDIYFQYYDAYYYKNNSDIDYFYKYYFDKYINSYYFSHCEEVINIG